MKKEQNKWKFWFAESQSNREVKHYVFVFKVQEKQPGKMKYI